MSKIEKSWLKYPETVYYSAKVDTNKFGKCSDLKTDFELCKAGLYFMQDMNKDPNFKFRLELPPNKFESSNLSDGTRFYRALNPRSCAIISKKMQSCTKLVQNTNHFLKNAFENNPTKFKGSGIIKDL